MAVIARGDPSSSVRAEAVKRLEDKALLRHISLTDSSDFVRAMTQSYFKYEGPEPWLTADDDEELRQMIIGYLINHTSYTNEQCEAEGENV